MESNNKIKLNWITVGILLLFWAGCASLYPSLPDQLPSHWNIQGEVDNYSHKSIVALVMPLLPLGIYIFMTIVPKIDPKRENYVKFSSSYEKIRLATVAVMVLVTLLPILVALGYNIDISLLMRIVIPILIIILGNYMGKVRHNYMVGIRLPWTLANEEVWNKTHRFGGKLMVIGGLFSLLGIFTSPSISFILVMSGIFIPLVASTIFSFLAYRKLTQ